MTSADGPIQIKRYPNRRYYARQAKAYVSLQDIERMVREGNTVEITDSQSGADITRMVLAQIIMEQHPDRFSVFPPAMLHAVLQANDAMSGFLREYFEQCLVYIEWLRRTGGSGAVPNPAEWMKGWMERMHPGSGREFTKAPPADADLVRRMADLEARLQRMEGRATKKGGRPG
ncbi:MAG: hypothetical protein KGS60_02300 [Verrucomicrobia bacterium]|nr:hypothetical protein [Verrucomicrobiota bacterium]